MRRQCELIGLPRSSYYREPGGESEENLELMKLIDEEYTRHPFYGSRKMKKYLRTLGYKVSRKRVQRLMRLMGLASIAPMKRTTVPSDGHKIYPYLLRNLDIDRPNMVWASDITYIRLRGGFVYLTVVMDWYSRYVLSREISVTMPACRSGRDGKGRAVDNIMVERLWRTMKYEDIYMKDYETVEDLKKGLRNYFCFTTMRDHTRAWVTRHLLRFTGMNYSLGKQRNTCLLYTSDAADE